MDAILARNESGPEVTTALAQGGCGPDVRPRATPEVAAKRPSATGNASESATNDMNVHKLITSFKLDLPKPQLLYFDGKYSEYNQFMHSFECNIGSIDSLNDRAKLNYLIQFCKGDAREFIESYVLLEPSEGYHKAKAMLREQYGRSHVVAREMIRDLVDGKEIKSNDGKALSELYKKMVKCDVTLTSSGSLSTLNSDDTCKAIIRRLPYTLRAKWKDRAYVIVKSEGCEARFSHLLEFIKECVESSNTMYGVDFEIQRNEYSVQRSKSSTKPHRNGGPHWSLKCPAIKNKPSLTQWFRSSVDAARVGVLIYQLAISLKASVWKIAKKCF